MDDDISSALKSKVPELQIDGASRAGALGAQGARYAETLVDLIADSNNDDVRFEVAEALSAISRDSGSGFGPVTVRIVPKLLFVLKGAQLTTTEKYLIAAALSYCDYDAMPNGDDLRDEVEEAVLEIKPFLAVDEAALSEVVDRIGRYSEGMKGRFTSKEWQILQFAVFDVFNLVAQIDGPPGIDKYEATVFMDLLKDPALSPNLFVQQLLSSILSDWKHVYATHQSQLRFDPDYFEKAFSRVKALIDKKLNEQEAQDFKFYLAVDFGGIIANASGNESAKMGRVSTNEEAVISRIANWLGTDMARQ